MKPQQDYTQLLLLIAYWPAQLLLHHDDHPDALNPEDNNGSRQVSWLVWLDADRPVRSKYLYKEVEKH